MSHLRESIAKNAMMGKVLHLTHAIQNIQYFENIQTKQKYKQMLVIVKHILESVSILYCGLWMLVYMGCYIFCYFVVVEISKCLVE